MRTTVCAFVAAVALAAAGSAAAHGHGEGAHDAASVPGGPGGGGGFNNGLGPGMSRNTIGGGAPGLGPSIRSTARQNGQGDAHAAEVAHNRADAHSVLTTSDSASPANAGAAHQDQTSKVKADTVSKTRGKLARQRRLHRQAPAHASTQGVAHANAKASL